MLDQNTDRMWYVIGAVIVGSVIIFLVNSSFPQLFASVGDTFKDKTEETSSIVDGIKPDQSTVHGYVNAHGGVELKRQGNDYLLTSDSRQHGGIRIDNRAVEYDKPYRLSFDIKKESGNIKTMGGHLTLGKDVKTYIDGKLMSNNWTNGLQNTYPNDTNAHKIIVEFTPDSSIVETDPGLNMHIYIQPNRTTGIADEGFVPYVPYSAWIINMTLDQIAN